MVLDRVFVSYFCLALFFTVKLEAQNGSGFSQRDSVQIRSFYPKDFSASEINYHITQDDTGILFFANENGILEFDGSNWQLHTTPNSDYFNIVKVGSDGRIYAGGRNEFGYFTRDDSTGALVYESIRDLLPHDLEIDICWQIKFIREKVYFQTYEGLIVFDGATAKFLAHKSTWILRSEPDILISVADKGLAKLINDSIVFVNESLNLGDDNPLALLEWRGRRKLLFTESNGVFLVDTVDYDIVKWTCEANAHLQKNGVWKVERSTDSTYMISHTVGGISLMDRKGRIHDYVDLPFQLNGGADFFKDLNGNLWIADLGIHQIIKFDPSLRLDRAPLIRYGGNLKKLDSLDILNFPEFKPKLLSFNFSMPGYDSRHLEFSSMLEGQDEDWSDWSKEFTRDYVDLSGGEYLLKVKSRFSGTESKVSYARVMIFTPWFDRISFKLGLIVLCIIILSYAIYYIYKSKEKWKTENKALVDEAENRYRGLLGNLDLGILEVDLEERITNANEAFCRMSGYSLSELRGQRGKDIFLGKDVDNSLERFESNQVLRRQGTFSAYEVSITRKDGSEIWVMISGAPIFNDRGEVIGSIGIHHDYTVQKNSHEILKEINTELIKRQEFLSAINEFSRIIADKQTIQEIGDVITQRTIEHFDFEDCVVYILDESKQALIQYSAYGPKAGLEGVVDNPLVIPKGKGVVGSVAQTGNAEIVLDTDKDPRYIVDDQFRRSELAVPIKYGNEIIGVIDSEHSEPNFYTQEHLETLSTIANLAAGRIRTAITLEENRIAQMELAESEATLRSIINSSLDAVIMINAEGVVTTWNKQSERIFGYSQEDAIGTSLTDLIVPPEYKKAHAAGMQHFIKTGEGPVLNKRIELKARNKEGKEFPIEISIAPIKLANQYYFSAFLRDITKEKDIKTQMEAALSKQKELNELKSHFVSMTSHELRTPLTTIKGNTELIDFQLENSKEIDKEKVKKNLLRIEQNADRLNHIVNNILFLGQLESKKIPYSPEFTVPHTFINKNILPDYHSRDISIEHKVTGEAREFKLDKRLFSQMITNLLDNAIKYSPGMPSPKLYLDYRPDSFEVVIQDFGIGISKEDQSHLFDTFFRASNVGNAQGTGLGLTIVNEFMKLHNGEIEVESELDVGTTFKLIFPDVKTN